MQSKVFIFSFMLITTSIYADIVSDAKQLIKEKKFTQAYQTLKKDEENHIDNNDFNYQLGVAALRSGHHSSALYALDRVLSENPNHIGAQLDMAIAYFHIGNLEFAEQEFKKILKNYQSDAPKIVVATINNYLIKIKQKNQTSTTVVVGSIDAGYSNNINSGIDGNSVYIPALGVNSSYAQKISSSFSKTQVVVSQNHKLNRNKTLNTVLAVNHKYYANNSQYDASNIIASASGKIKKATEAYTYGVTGVRSYLDKNHKYNLLSTNFGRQLTPSKSQSYGVKIKHARLRFSDTESQINDTNKTTLLLNHSGLIADKSIGMVLTLNTGKTNVLDDTNPNGNSSFTGLSSQFKKALNGGIISTTLSHQQSSYKSINSLFQIKRKDKVSSTSIKYLKPIQKGLVLDLGLSYRDQNSNIPIYKNNKMTVSFGIKRTF